MTPAACRRAAWATPAARQDQHHRVPGGPDGAGNGLDGIAGRGQAHGSLGDDRIAMRRQPGAVGGEDQADGTARRPEAGGYGFGGQAGHGFGTVGRFRPDGIGRHQGGDVRVQRGVVLAVVGGVVADHVDDRREGAPRIVQVRHAVAVAWAEVQQGAGRPLCDPAIAIGCPGGHAFELAEHRAHRRRAIQGGDKLHFAGARVGETGCDLIGQQGGEQGVGAVHGRSPNSEHHHVRWRRIGE